MWYMNENRELIRESAREFAQKELAPVALEMDASEDFPMAQFKRAGELGFLGITMPQEYGGMGADYTTLALVYEEYAAFLKERGLLDENGYLALFPEKLASGAVRGVNVIFFGFTSFTRQAAEGILAAAQHAKSLTGIFPAGKEPYYTNESARVFRSVCPDAEVRLADSPLTGEAERVRRSMFSPEAAFLAPERSPRVHVMRPQDEWEEARFVCARIKKYVREEGLRYRDIAVLATETSALERELAAYGIPCFADVKRPFSRHPFCAYVLAVLRVAADGGLPESVDAAAANVCFGDGSLRFGSV